MRRIFSQAGKELAQFKRDRLTLSLAFLLPSVAMLLYGYATRLESKDIPVAVKNFDNGALSREYIDTIFANGQLTPVRWRGNTPLSPLDYGDAKATITIPPEFSRKIRQQQSSPVQVIIDATDVNNARVIKNSIIATTAYYLRSHDLSQVRSRISTRVRLWFNPGREESLYVAPGATAVILWIFPCLLAALAMAREKEQGTILQLYASSISSFELVAGKAVAYTGIAFVQAVIVIVMSMALFGIRLVGDPIIYLISITAFLASSVLFGLFVGTRASTQSAAVQMVATTGFTTALLLSGFLYPLRNITYPLSLICNILPARYFVEASRNAFVRGSDFTSQIHLPVALGLCALVLFMGAARIMRKMQLSS
jgi:ABC-2 type transport system permease protein